MTSKTISFNTPNHFSTGLSGQVLHPALSNQVAPIGQPLNSTAILSVMLQMLLNILKQHSNTPIGTQVAEENPQHGSLFDTPGLLPFFANPFDQFKETQGGINQQLPGFPSGSAFPFFPNLFGTLNQDIKDHLSSIPLHTSYRPILCKSGEKQVVCGYQSISYGSSEESSSGGLLSPHQLPTVSETQHQSVLPILPPPKKVTGPDHSLTSVSEKKPKAKIVSRTKYSTEVHTIHSDKDHQDIHEHVYQHDIHENADHHNTHEHEDHHDVHGITDHHEDHHESIPSQKAISPIDNLLALFGIQRPIVSNPPKSSPQEQTVNSRSDSHVPHHHRHHHQNAKHPRHHNKKHK